MIVNFLKNNKLLLLVFLMGIFLRLFMLGQYMPYLFRDEAALGYNAYSIWLTGKDEFGVFMPIVFRSFEVFFLPLYSYLAAPIVGVLGLSIFSTRLLSSLSGILAMLIIYKIVDLFWNKAAAIFVVVSLAFSPWHIFYSRGTFEGNLALTLLYVGVYFWMLFRQRKIFKYFALSTFAFALSMYSYQSARVIVPIFALYALLSSHKDIWSIRNKVFLWSFLLIFLLMPLVSLSFKAGGLHRAAGVSIFTQDNPPGWVEGMDSGLLMNNIYFLRARQVVSLYLSYFSAKNIFWLSDSNMQRGLDHISVFYFWGLPFLFFGLIKLLKRNNILDRIVLLLMFASPIPASLTADPFHTYRSLNLYFALTILIGIGAYESLKFMKSKAIYAYLLINLISLPFFIYNYSVLAPVTRASDWDAMNMELMSVVSKLPSDKRVVVFDRDTESYIHYLFYNQIEPKEYQQAIYDLNLDPDYYYNDPSEIRASKFRNIEFREVDWPSERGDKGTYFVFNSKLLPDSEFKTDPNVELITELFFPDGVSAYKIVHVKDE